MLEEPFFIELALKKKGAVMFFQKNDTAVNKLIF